MSIYVTTSEAALRLGLKPQTLRAWRLHGTGPLFVRLGNPKTGRVAYSLDDIEEYVNARKFSSTSQETVAVTGAMHA